jgi:hypothetical protein
VTCGRVWVSSPPQDVVSKKVDAINDTVTLQWTVGRKQVRLWMQDKSHPLSTSTVGCAKVDSRGSPVDPFQAGKCLEQLGQWFACL